MGRVELQDAPPQDKMGEKCVVYGLVFITLVGLLSVAEPHAKKFFHREEDTEAYSNYILLQRNNFKPSSGFVRIKNSEAFKYLEEIENNDVVLGVEGQAILIQEHGSYCELQFADSKMYLDVYGGKMTEDQLVWAYEGNHTAAQRWRLVAVPGEEYAVYITIGDYSALTYDNESGITIIRAFTGNEDQKWIIEEL